MCGICGVINFVGVTDGDRSAVRRMAERLEHRGPDGDGFWAGDFAALGHRRLAIIDLEGGWQPLFNETRDVAVVFNGEIYNYRELRHELETHGHRFRTSGDTEVIAHGYEQWGEDVVERLRGMFTFALCDVPRRRVLLARDRLGVKPLYYHVAQGGERLLFASEIKSLFADESVPRELNRARLAEYLMFRSVAGEETLFAGVRELAPGTVLTLEAGRRSERRYWSPRADEDRDEHGSGDTVERGRELFADAVESRLVSDVELGTITSGGLDSSLVSAVAAEVVKDGGTSLGRDEDARIDTFCVGFDDPAFDERPFAETVAKRIGSRHHSIVVTPEEIERELDRLTWAHDEPLTHPNSVPMHLIFRHAKEDTGITVLLSGEGADEVFGGYERYGVLARLDKLRRRVPSFNALTKLAPPVGKIATLKRISRDDYPITANAFADASLVNLLSPLESDCLSERERLWSAAERSAAGMFVYDQQTYLLPLLQRQDRMSMAAGLEAREPFLDHHLVEWANGLNVEVKLAGGVRKALLKEIARRWLPDEIIFRRKVGFEMPLGAWMRPGGALANRVEALRDGNSFVASAMNHNRVVRLIDEHRRAAANHADILWTLIALESWAQVFLGEDVQGERLPGAATGKNFAVSGGV